MQKPSKSMIYWAFWGLLEGTRSRIGGTGGSEEAFEIKALGGVCHVWCHGCRIRTPNRDSNTPKAPYSTTSANVAFQYQFLLLWCVELASL